VAGGVSGIESLKQSPAIEERLIEIAVLLKSVTLGITLGTRDAA